MEELEHIREERKRLGLDADRDGDADD